MAKVPRFSQFHPASDVASKIKRQNRAQDTKPELLLRRELWRLGLRYRLHAALLPGKPDIVFPAAKVAVFCDGDFWHGRGWRSRRAKLARGANARYWIPKIEANIARDHHVTRELRALGWTVLRFWETDLSVNLAAVAEEILLVVRR
jgi:DNA mismatch endonuclease Vsr